MSDRIPKLQDLERMAHGEQVTIGEETLVMNREYPRVAFDTFGPDGRFRGYIYPHNVASEYASPEDGTG